MKQQQFEMRHQQEWLAFEEQLALLEGSKKDVDRKKLLADFPEQYRRLCHQFALAKARGYSLPLIEKLNELILHGHRQLYRHRLPIVAPLVQFIAYGFPRAVREQASWNLLSGFSFVFALCFMWVLVALHPDMIYSMLDVEQVDQISNMYDPTAGFRAMRDGSDDIAMFGHYIWNNIGIAFRTFASGLFFGVGVFVTEIFNGAFFGAIAAHLINIHHDEPFFTFVVAHGAPELTAIVLSGGSGMRLGWALLAPGALPRLQALQRAARKAMPVMYGTFALLLIAAFVEAFWSPRDFAPAVKYSVGAAFWLLLYAYLLFSGRGRSHAA